MADDATRTFGESENGLPVELALLLEQACDRFEAQWRAGDRPDLAAAIRDLPEAIRPAARREFVALEFYYRNRSGESPVPADYPDLDPEWLAGLTATFDPERRDRTATGEVPASLPSGTVVGYFGDYELLGEIARGGMGIVYRARQLSLDRAVALKMIRSGEFAGPGEARRFRQEVEAVAALDHPHIVPIHEVGEHAGRPYYTMRLLEGGSLSSRIADFAVTAANGRAEARRRQTASAVLLGLIARAVHHAHQRGILHRDLKPSNVLLDGKGEPHVVDFGLARRIGSASSLTATGAVLGTPSYMAPEQARGGADVTTQVDVYGLGAVLYELLTGRPPFKGIDALDTVAQVREREVTRPRTVCDLIDRDLETICLKCLAKDPASRYDSASALADDLERWGRGEAIVARRVGRLELARKWARRNPAVAALVAVSALFLLAAVGGGVALGYSRTLEGKNRDLAVAKDEADVQRGEAETQRTRAEREEAESWRLLYFTRMHQANAAFQVGNTERVIELLTPYRDPTPGKPDPRGFEWQYLWKMARGDLFTIRAHPGGINAVAYSGDGKQIATGGADGTVRLWDAANGAAGAVFDAGEGTAKVTGVGFVPGSTWLAASLSRDTRGEIRVWDTRTQRVVHELPFAGRVNGMAIHPDGKHVAVACEDGLVLIANWDRGRVFERKARAAARCVAFSSDGSRLAGGGTAGWIGVWEWVEGRIVTFGGDPKDARRVDDLAFAVNGNAILATFGDYPPMGPSWSDIEILTSPPSSDSLPKWKYWKPGFGAIGVSQSRFLPTGDVAIAAGDGSVLVLDRAARKLEVSGSYRGHGASDRATRKVEVSGSYRGHVGSVRALSVEPGGRFLATAGHSASSDRALGELRVWDLRRYREPLDIRGYHGRGVAPNVRISISPDGKWVATPIDDPQDTPDQVVRVCSAVTGAENYRLRGGGSDGAVSFSPDGHWLAASSREGFVVCRADTGAEHYRVRFPPKFVNLLSPLKFSPDSRYLAVGVENAGTVWLHDVANRKEIRTLKHIEDDVGHSVFGFAFSPNCARLAIVSERGMTLWQVDTGIRLQTLRVQAWTVAFSPDGLRLATAGEDGVMVFDALDGNRRLTVSALGPEGGGANSCEYSPDGRRLLTAQDDTVRLWDAASGQELLTIPAEGVRTASMTSDGNRIAICFTTGLIRFVDVPSPEPIPDLDAVELIQVRRAQVPLWADLVERLKTEPALAPATRIAALFRAGWESDSADEIRAALWGVFPIENVTRPAALRQLRLSEAYLRLRPHDKHEVLGRAVALYHLGRDPEAEATLAELRFLTPSGSIGAPADEGYRLGFRTLTLIRLKRIDDARVTLQQLQQSADTNLDWTRIPELQKLLSATRKAVPQPLPIQKN